MGSRIKVGLFEQRGTEGAAYLELRHYSTPADSTLVRVEFNPNKLPTFRRVWLLDTLKQQATSTIYVDRFDVAFDYHGIRRDELILDDRTRSADLFSVRGGLGAETVRTGYRRGSQRKHQLYDKKAERKAKGDVTLEEDVVRYEVQRIFQSKQAPPVDALPFQPWDWEPKLRRLNPDGFQATKARLAVLRDLARHAGVPLANMHAKNLLQPKDRERWLAHGLPEMNPSPQSMFEAGWHGVATEVLNG